MSFQNATYYNSGGNFYGNPKDWSNFSTINSTILFNDTNATLTAIPAIPDSDTTLTWNGNQLAYVSDIPNLANWAQYPANADVNIPPKHILNCDTAYISTLYVDTQTTENNVNVSTFFASTLYAENIFSPNINISTLYGPSINVLADEGVVTTAPSAINLNTANGSYGQISLTANAGQLGSLGGQTNITSNGGNGPGGLYGAVNIIANAGTDVLTGVQTGGKVFIQANTGAASQTASGAITLSAAGINSYAGYATPIGSLAGYNFINGTLGVSLVASLIPNSSYQVPGTVYIYGDTGISMGSPVYASNIYPYWNGNTAPPNLVIQGRTTIIGTASVVLDNVSSINGASYPPAVTTISTFTTASISSLTASTINGVIPNNPNLQLSTLTINNIGGITTPYVNASTINVSTINGVKPNNPNLILSTLTINNVGGLITTPAINTSTINVSTINSFPYVALPVANVLGEIAVFNGTKYAVQSTLIGIGSNTNASSAGTYAVSIGYDAGQTNTGNNAISIGNNAGNLNTGNNTVNIGLSAGTINAQVNSMSIGNQAGISSIGAQAIAIGTLAGQYGLGTNAVSIGYGAGNTAAGTGSVSIGIDAGNVNLGTNAVAIGNYAGNISLGANSIAIGNNASSTGGGFGQTIVLNASGNALNPAQAGSTYIRPVRATPANVAYQNNLMFYNTTTYEVTYDAFDFTTVVQASGGTIAPIATYKGRIYVLTGITTTAIANTGATPLTANDVGFYFYIRNGNVSSGSVKDITLTGVSNNTVVHGASNTQNAGMIMIYWDGTTFQGY